MKPWYEKFGWIEDPFSTRPNEKLVGVNKEINETLNYIYSGSIVLITGPTGCGKTSLLLWLEKTLGESEYTPIRINCVENHTRKNIYTSIKHTRNTIDKLLFKKFPKKPVLLLDETQYLQKDAGELIKVWWDDKKIHSVVLASIKDTLDNLTGSFIDRLKGQVISLPPGTPELVANLIDLRTGGKNPFDNDAIDTIAICSEGIPRRALEICRKICMACAEREVFKINKNHVSVFLPLVREVKSVFPTIETTQREQTETEKTLLTVERQKTKTKKTAEQAKRQSFEFALSPMQNEIVNLLEKEELSAEQLATLLKTSVGSIRKQLSRLKERKVITIADFTRRPVTYKLSEDYVRKNVKE